MVLSVDSATLLLDTVCENTIGIDEMASKSELLVYPNPSNGQFTIEFSSIPQEQAELKIINLLGEEIYSESISIINNSHRQKLDVSKYAKSIYFLRLNTSGIILSQKIIVQ